MSPQRRQAFGTEISEISVVRRESHPQNATIRFIERQIACPLPPRNQLWGQGEQPSYRRYSPGNIVLAGAGRIDFDALVAVAERCCGGWQPRSRPAARWNRPSGRSGFHVLHKETATQQYPLQLAAGPAAEDHDRYAAKLLATVLGDDSGSRLYWELVDPGPGRTRQLEPRRAPRRRHDDDLHELRAASRRPTICNASSTCTGRSKPTASRRPSWNRPRARFAPASCFPASVPAAGCLPWATTGSTAANTSPSRRNWPPWPALRSTILPRCWRNIR